MHVVVPQKQNAAGGARLERRTYKSTVQRTRSGRAEQSIVLPEGALKPDNGPDGGVFVDVTVVCETCCVNS